MNPIHFCLITALIVSSGCTTAPPNTDNFSSGNEIAGYYELNGETFSCKITRPDNFTAHTEFYAKDGAVIGSCSSYNGPGGSGMKGGCSGPLSIPYPEDSPNKDYNFIQTPCIPK